MLGAEGLAISAKFESWSDQISAFTREIILCYLDRLLARKQMCNVCAVWRDIAADFVGVMCFI